MTKQQHTSASLEEVYLTLSKQLSSKKRRDLKKTLREVRLPIYFRLIGDDIANFKQYIEPSSVDYIITDPPYSQKYLYLYELLGELASFALKEDGLCIIMTGQSYLPEVLHILSKRLIYVWTMAYLTPGGQSPYIWPIKCNTFWKPLLVFGKKKKRSGVAFSDVVKTSVNNNDKRYHKWGQSVEGFYLIMEKFVFPGQVIFDPFLGGGSTAVASFLHGCSFIGFDKSKDCVVTTKQRIEALAEESGNQYSLEVKVDVIL